MSRYGYKRILIKRVGLVLCIFLLVSATLIIYKLQENNGVLKEKVHEYMLSRLRIDVPVTEFDNRSESEPTRMIYVLSGDFDALRERFALAATLLKKNKGEVIVLIDRPEWHIYTARFGKNLSFRDWVIAEMLNYDIRTEQIIFIDAQEGFWGTLSEAQRIRKFLHDAYFREVITVTSAYHTKRSQITFTEVLKPYPVFTYGSIGDWPLRYFMSEAFKLPVYKYVLLHIWKST